MQSVLEQHLYLSFTYASQEKSQQSCHEQDLDKLINDLKEQFHKNNSHLKKIQILTLKPDSWSNEKTMTFFECSRYAAKQARQLKCERGVLARPQRMPCSPAPIFMTMMNILT